MTLPVFVINLPDNQARREFMTLQLNALGMNTTLWPAVDGRALSEQEVTQHYDDAKARRYRRALTRGEIGCALSHIGIYRHMVAQNLPYALILEDDAAIGKMVPMVLEEVSDVLEKKKPTLLLLTRMGRFCTRGSKKLTAHHRLVRVWKAWFAHGYLINLAAAAELIQELYPIFTVPDDWNRLRRQAPHVDLWGINPYCIGQSTLSAASSLEEAREEVTIEAALAKRRSVCEFFHTKLNNFWHGVTKQPHTW
jgi:glycosyl transferase family 25